MTDTNVDT